MKKAYCTIFAFFLCLASAYAQIRPIGPRPTVEDNFPHIESSVARLCIPLRFPIPYLRTFEQNVCEYYDGNYQDGGLNLIPPVAYFVNVDYKVWRELPIDVLELHGDSFSIAEKIYYSADGYVIIGAIPVAGQCGWDDEAAREIIIGYDSKFGFSENYSLTTKTKRKDIVNPNRCKLTLLNRDVTDNLNRLIEKFLDQGASKVDELVPRITDFKQPLIHLWDVLQEPIKINERTWLTLGMEKLSGGQILVSNGNPQFVSTTIGVTFKPEIHEGNEPSITPVSLPSLTLENCTPGFEVQSDISMSFDDLDAKVNANSADNIFQIGRRRLLLNNVHTYSSGQHVVLELTAKLRAAKPQHPRNRFLSSIGYFFDNLFYRRNAKMYIIGTPSTNPRTNNFKIVDAKFDPETETIIKHKAPWIKNTKIIATLETRSNTDISLRIDELKAGINSGLTKTIDNITLSAATGSFMNEKTFIYKDRIYSRFKLTVNLSGNYRVD